MKYYGIRRKKRRERFIYWYAKYSIKIKGTLPCKHHKYFKQSYNYTFREVNFFTHENNEIPKGHWFRLNQIVTSDLILRENIGELQKGIRTLLRKYRAGDRFINLNIDSLEKICRTIDEMDSSLLQWHNSYDCGVFEFQSENLKSCIDYFIIKINNINSSYLSIEFRLFLTKEKALELERLINMDYRDLRGCAQKMLVSNKNGGSFNSYLVEYKNDDYLKADKISELLSCIEWEFYNSLRKHLPFVLHNRGIMPPRIEVYNTDIDYHENHRNFWNSIGVSPENGQFIDERQKMFFDYTKSRDDKWFCPRLLYVIKDDDIEAGRFESVKDRVYCHIDNYSCDYFKFFFIRILSHETGKTVINIKHQLNRIKLKKNRFNTLLKLRYSFEREIDSYMRYVNDDIWEKSQNRLREGIYKNNDALMEKIDNPYYTSYKHFCNNSLSCAKSIDEAIKDMRNEFDNKAQILKHLSDYKYSSRNWHLSIIMFILAAATLFFVIFPDKAGKTAELIEGLISWIENLLGL